MFGFSSGQNSSSNQNLFAQIPYLLQQAASKNAQPSPQSGSVNQSSLQAIASLLNNPQQMTLQQLLLKKIKSEQEQLMANQNQNLITQLLLQRLLNQQQQLPQLSNNFNIQNLLLGNSASNTDSIQASLLKSLIKNASPEPNNNTKKFDLSLLKPNDIIKPEKSYNSKVTSPSGPNMTSTSDAHNQKNDSNQISPNRVPTQTNDIQTPVSNSINLSEKNSTSPNTKRREKPDLEEYFGGARDQTRVVKPEKKGRQKQTPQKSVPKQIDTSDRKSKFPNRRRPGYLDYDDFKPTQRTTDPNGLTERQLRQQRRLNRLQELKATEETKIEKEKEENSKMVFKKYMVVTPEMQTESKVGDSYQVSSIPKLEKKTTSIEKRRNPVQRWEPVDFAFDYLDHIRDLLQMNINEEKALILLKRRGMDRDNATRIVKKKRNYYKSYFAGTEIRVRGNEESEQE